MSIAEAAAFKGGGRSERSFDILNSQDKFGLATLAELNPGDTAVVHAVANAGAKARRIMTLGITPGASVKMLRRAPLGDPMEFEVSGCLLTLRAEEASLVSVEEAQHG